MRRAPPHTKNGADAVNWITVRNFAGPFARKDNRLPREFGKCRKLQEAGT
jgi:hypothetical protein